MTVGLADLVEAAKEDRKHDRRPVSFYLSDSLVEEFKVACGPDVVVSRVIENLIRSLLYMKSKKR